MYTEVENKITAANLIEQMTETKEELSNDG